MTGGSLGAIVDDDGNLWVEMRFGDRTVVISEEGAIAFHAAIEYILNQAHTIPGYKPTDQKPFVCEQINGVILNSSIRE